MILKFSKYMVSVTNFVFNISITNFNFSMFASELTSPLVTPVSVSVNSFTEKTSFRSSFSPKSVLVGRKKLEVYDMIEQKCS